MVIGGITTEGMLMDGIVIGSIETGCMETVGIDTSRTMRTYLLEACGPLVT